MFAVAKVSCSITRMKTCSKCQETKPLDLFPVDRDKRRKNPGHKSICRACESARVKAYQQTNKDRVYAYQAEWRDGNRTQWNAAMAAVCKRRHAAKLRRVPPWFDAAKAREVYDLAAEFRQAGFVVDVDHILPLQGERVSGLHWHGNLRVCLATANRSKRNEISPFHDHFAI